MTEMLRNLPFSEDNVIGARARIGLITLASDWTIEQEMREAIAPLTPDVALYQARIPNSSIITTQSLADMGPRLTETASLVLPGGHLDAIAFGCTSASTVLGEDMVAAAIRAAKPDAQVTNPITAAKAAFDALGMRRIAVLTPYTTAVNARILEHLEAAGYEIPVFGSFDEEDDAVVGRISAGSIHDSILRMVRTHDVDGVFVSCTSLRLLPQIAELEVEFMLPVISSNLALAWHLLHLAGSALPSNWGRLSRQCPRQAPVREPELAPRSGEVQPTKIAV